MRNDNSVTDKINKTGYGSNDYLKMIERSNYLILNTLSSWNDSIKSKCKTKNEEMPNKILNSHLSLIYSFNLFPSTILWHLTNFWSTLNFKMLCYVFRCTPLCFFCNYAAWEVAHELRHSDALVALVISSAYCTQRCWRFVSWLCMSLHSYSQLDIIIVCHHTCRGRRRNFRIFLNILVFLLTTQRN
jgi:hypothetical protein